METRRTSVLADRPLLNPDDDRLGYAPFAKHLSVSLQAMIGAEGLVIALYGAWGSGKTTLLNFVEYFLGQEQEEDDRPVVVKFDPWWFSGHEDLAFKFFEQLLGTLSSRQVFSDEVRNKLADFASLVSTTPIPHAWTAEVAARVLKPEGKDIHGLKEEIRETLERQQSRILVIIDDIDRLLAEEIRQLFRVIKAVADFPNITYLLAFDKEVAVRALADAQRIPGEAYLEKIVQVPFELPVPDDTSLRQLLSEKLATVLDDTPEELFDQTYWSEFFWGGIDHFIDTPRDIIRLTNTLSVTYSTVRGEVNPADFVAVEALRVFRPEVYDVVRKNKNQFAGTTHYTGLHSDDRVAEQLKSFHETWLAEVPDNDREAIKKLTQTLFPRLEAVWTGRNIVYGPDWRREWRKERRVCSTENFQTYFRLAIPEGSITRTEMEAILALARDAQAFGKELLELARQRRADGTTRARALLERLQDYAEEDIPESSISPIVEAFLDVGDDLLCLDDERVGTFDLGNEFRMDRVTWGLLRRLDEPQRYEILKKAIKSGRALYTIVGEVATLGQQHGKLTNKPPDPASERIVTADHLTCLEALALDKIRDAASKSPTAKDSLLQSYGLEATLYRWEDWGSVGDIKDWAIRLDREGITDADLTEDQRTALVRFTENRHK